MYLEITHKLHYIIIITFIIMKEIAAVVVVFSHEPARERERGGWGSRVFGYLALLLLD